MTLENYYFQETDFAAWVLRVYILALAFLSNVYPFFVSQYTPDILYDFFLWGHILFFSDLNMTFSTFFVLLLILMMFTRESTYTAYNYRL